MEQKMVLVYHIRYLQQQLDVNESSSSRPSLGFPLGIALLLIVVFSLSGIFTCCYYWDKLRNLNGRNRPHLSDHPSSNSKPTPPSMALRKQEVDAESVTAVIMAGDEIAKFIALPCPCQPYRPPQQLPYKPPVVPTYFPVPLYI